MDGVNTPAAAGDAESQALISNGAAGSEPRTSRATWGFYLYSWAIEASSYGQTAVLLSD